MISANDEKTRFSFSQTNQSKEDQMTYVHIVMDTLNNTVVIVTTSLKAAQTVAATDSSFVVVQDEPVIYHTRLSSEDEMLYT